MILKKNNTIQNENGAQRIQSNYLSFTKNIFEQNGSAQKQTHNSQQTKQIRNLHTNYSSTQSRASLPSQTNRIPWSATQKKTGQKTNELQIAFKLDFWSRSRPNHRMPVGTRARSKPNLSMAKH